MQFTKWDIGNHDNSHDNNRDIDRDIDRDTNLYVQLGQRGNAWQHRAKEATKSKLRATEASSANARRTQRGIFDNKPLRYLSSFN